MVVSDHGFTRFDRGANLNVWLRREGYLVLKEGGRGGDHLEDVDWSRTRAFALGLSGIYLNRRDRGGCVPPEAAQGLKREIADKLAALRDGKRATPPVLRVIDSAAEYAGPFTEDAPDLIVGYNDGYRASWETAVGATTDGDLFADNTRPWNGDHCVDRSLVPGVFFCSRGIEGGAAPR